MTSAAHERLAVARPGSPAEAARGAILAIGFGTTVAMWAIGYVTHLPAVSAPGWLVGALMVLPMLAGGYVAGRWWQPDWRAGLRAGLLTSLLNMLVLGSLLASREVPNRVVPSALLWLPGALLFGAALGSLGALIGARAAVADAPVPGSGAAGGSRVNWTLSFAMVDAVATLLLLAVGGLVTSEGAGLSVVDWPNSFGYNMFLYPLSRMTGGIYYEHAHRLFGSLVGLTTLVLALHLATVDERRFVRRLGFASLAFVVVQGLLGGLRVTGRFTFSTSSADTAPSTLLAIVHGVGGQLFFVLLIALAALSSVTWRSATRPIVSRTVDADRSLGPALIGALVLQLVLGAVLRHEGAGLVVHVSMAAIVFTLAAAVGLRAWGFNDRPPIVKKLGLWLIGIASLQCLLGLGAIIAVGAAPGRESAGTLRALLATPHQVTGAILLGVASALVLWTRRLLVPDTAS
jgi:heme A synthase